MLRKNASGLNEPMNMPKSAPATPTKNAEMTNAIVRSRATPTPIERAAALVLARCAQTQADARALKRPRRGHRRRGPAKRDPDRRRGRDPGHAGRAVRQLLPVPRDDVHDGEHGERREPRGQAGQASERHGQKQRERGGYGSRDDRRRKRREVRAGEKARQVGQDERLRLGRDHEDRARVGADRHERGVPEREDARHAHERVQADDDDHVDHHPEHDAIERVRPERDRDERHEAGERHECKKRPDRRPARPREDAGPGVVSDRVRRPGVRRERRARGAGHSARPRGAGLRARVWRGRGGAPAAGRPGRRARLRRRTRRGTAGDRAGATPAGSTVRTPIEKPPSTAPRRLPIPPRIVAMKAISTMLTPIVGDAVPVCAVSRIAARSGEQPRERERGGDHGVGPDPEHAGHAEVLRGGAHLRAERRPPEEEADGHEQRRASRRR